MPDEYHNGRYGPGEVGMEYNCQDPFVWEVAYAEAANSSGDPELLHDDGDAEAVE